MRQSGDRVTLSSPAAGVEASRGKGGGGADLHDQDQGGVGGVGIQQHASRHQPVYCQPGNQEADAREWRVKSKVSGEQGVGTAAKVVVPQACHRGIHQQHKTEGYVEHFVKVLHV